MTESEIFAALKPRYTAGEWALLPQVRNETGFAKKVRTADAVAVSLFPSRGIDAHGFEFKDSRADWLKELKEPEKAEEIGRWCAFWWVVVSDPAIVKRDELPPLWGLLSVAGGAAKVVTKAPRRPAQEPGWAFVAAVLRSAQKYATPEAEIEARIEKVKAETANRCHREGIEMGKRDAAHRLKDLEALAKRVDEFEAASGVNLGRYSYDSPQKIGAAVRFVMDGGMGCGTLRQIANLCDRMKRTAEEAIAQIDPTAEKVTA